MRSRRDIVAFEVWMRMVTVTGEWRMQTGMAQALYGRKETATTHNTAANLRNREVVREALAACCVGRRKLRKRKALVRGNMDRMGPREKTLA
jgi:hypothetical protein